VTEQPDGALIAEAEQAIARARDAELAVGRVRGRIAEFQTQIDRAEQDIALGWRYWLARNGRERIRGRRRPRRMGGPLITVITPVFETEPAHLAACLASVAAQTYGNWEHVLVDDGSSDQRVHDALASAARREARVRHLRHERNRGIVAASTTALESAGGEYIAMLDHDDVLAPNALARLVDALRDNPEASFAYSDNDVLRGDGRFADPFFKPDFSPERLRNHNYVLHFVMAPAARVREVGGFRPGFDGAQDHDLLLRLSEVGPAVHVPEVLYHWREAPASVAADPAAKPYAYDAGVRAVQEHCDRAGIAASVAPGVVDGVYRVQRAVPADQIVSIVIPTRGATAAVWGIERVLVAEAMRSIVEHSSFGNVEFVVVVDAATPADVVEGIRRVGGERVTIVPSEGEFNFSAKVNAGARSATGDLLLFLNDDTELIAPGSVGEMAALLQQADVGMVGAKLLYSDGTLQHAGHVFPGLASHALLGYPGDHPGPYRMAIVERECSGVTAAAAMVRADVFRELGGFDEELPRNFNDVDLSFRMREAGYRIVWTPHAAWYHFESASRDPRTGEAERELLLSRWRDRIEYDPYYNVNLAPHRTDWLERPGRSGAPPYYLDDEGRRRYS
jgi:GT2 family glycosyltransferase